MPDKRFMVKGREILKNKLTLGWLVSWDHRGEKRALSVHIFPHADKITVSFGWHSHQYSDNRGDEKAGRPSENLFRVLRTSALPSFLQEVVECSRRNCSGVRQIRVQIHLPLRPVNHVTLDQFYPVWAYSSLVKWEISCCCEDYMKKTHKILIAMIY